MKVICSVYALVESSLRFAAQCQTHRTCKLNTLESNAGSKLTLWIGFNGMIMI